MQHIALPSRLCWGMGRMDDLR
eukprot:SAG11_NODE_16703_length_540_cov_0.696145_1_plen_21_part_10